MLLLTLKMIERRMVKICNGIFIENEWKRESLHQSIVKFYFVSDFFVLVNQ